MPNLAHPEARELDRDRWERLKSIVADALEHDSPAARAALVEGRCAGDFALSREAASLLAAADSLGRGGEDSIEECAEHAMARLWDEDSLVGRRVGAYVVVRELGRGGMGAVYLGARADGEFEKEVAIKVLKRGTDTHEILRRFKVERQILARLEHPNIARLIDAGTTQDGLPYFVMEYVEGIPLTRFVQERKLSGPERLALFLKVCSAVELAHRAHVIHRDLKPGNILVNADGEAKLLDFGIAKLLASDDSALDLTAPAQQHLTPNCASPEQARGEPVTTASDIYALGALLYEMLTGRHPHRFRTKHPTREELAQVCARMPERPSSVAGDAELQREVRGNLDRIVLSAMRNDPADRYSSVGELAADIKRHLARETVKAPAHSWHDRIEGIISRFGGRRWQRFAWVAAAVAVGAITVLVLASGPSPHSTAFSAAARGATDPAPAKSIAVLPFQNLSQEPANAFFVTGIQEAVLSRLAKIGSLKVISGTSVADYAQPQARNFRQISEQLGVAYLLEGSVQRAGERVRVTAKLIDSKSGAQRWAETYDRNLADVFAIQSEIAAAICAHLEVTLLPSQEAEMARPGTRDFAAYELYAQAKELVGGYLDAADQGASLHEAIRLLEAAIERDPNFVLAYCHLGRAHTLLFALTVDPNGARLARAGEAIRTALRLDPTSGEAHLILAEFHWRGFGRNTEARQELEIAQERLPNEPFVYGLRARIQRDEGEWENAELSFAKAVELDPRNTNSAYLLADTQVLRRHYSDAIRTYERVMVSGAGAPHLMLRIAEIQFAATGDAAKYRAALAAAPADLDVGGRETPARILTALIDRDYESAARILAASPREEFQETDFTFYYPRSWYEAMIARARGDRDGMIAAFSKTRVLWEEGLRKAPRRRRLRAVLAQVYAGLGEKDAATREARLAVEQAPIVSNAYNGAIVLQALAQVYTWTGEKDLALETIEKVVAMPGYLSYGYLRWDPAWEPLRDDARFTAIVNSLAPKDSE